MLNQFRAFFSNKSISGNGSREFAWKRIKRIEYERLSNVCTIDLKSTRRFTWHKVINACNTHTRTLVPSQGKPEKNVTGTMQCHHRIRSADEIIEKRLVFIQNVCCAPIALLEHTNCRHFARSPFDSNCHALTHRNKQF